ncbi:MAG TPA: hypothetical protein VNW92_08805, partial [Polyangiaceae bacterium]|nr:hypothetical protein [Polyangiaceae bacterium]
PDDVVPPAPGLVPSFDEPRGAVDALSSSADEHAAIAAVVSTTHDLVHRRMIPWQCKAQASATRATQCVRFDAS